MEKNNLFIIYIKINKNIIIIFQYCNYIKLCNYFFIFWLYNLFNIYIPLYNTIPFFVY